MQTAELRQLGDQGRQIVKYLQDHGGAVTQRKLSDKFAHWGCHEFWMLLTSMTDRNGCHDKVLKTELRGRVAWVVLKQNAQDQI